MKKKLAVIVIASVMSIVVAMPVFAGWFQENGRWKYREGSNPPCTNAAKKIDGKVYYFDENGYMVTGWKNRDGFWYCYDESGALIRDQWIDNTYYVGNNGRLFVNEYTSDGYFVGSDGKYDPTVDRLNGPGGMISKQPASAYTGAPLDEGNSSATFASSNQTQSTGNADSVLTQQAEASVSVPVSVIGGGFTIDSAAGVTPFITFQCHSDRTIKYIRFEATPYNRVFDPITCMIRGYSTHELQATGPFYKDRDNKLGFYYFHPKKGLGIVASGKKVLYLKNQLLSDVLSDEAYKNEIFEDDHAKGWDVVWYNSTIFTIKVTKVTVEYMDGGIESYECNAYLVEDES